MLDYLNCFSPKNLEGSFTKITIQSSFMEKYESTLIEYQEQAFEIYKKSIDTLLLKIIVERHIKEQAYKDFWEKIRIKTGESRDKAYDKICDNNLSFIIYLYQSKKNIGTKNIGFLSNDLYNALNIAYLKPNEKLQDDILAAYGLPPDTDIHVDREIEVFQINLIYNILYHNAKSFEALTPYHQEAIRLGYLHPRAYASLQYNTTRGKGTSPVEKDMVLEKFWQGIKDTKHINEMRKAFHLPPYEVDYQKFLFGQKHNLKLSFGFFNGTL